MCVRWRSGFGKVERMIQTRFFEPTDDAATEGWIGPGWQVADLIREVLDRSSARGHPAAELIREDSSSVSLGTDGEWAVLVWVDSLGDSHHSVGDGGGKELIYDYFGSWSEAPSDWQVPLAHAIEAMEQFVHRGTPVTQRVIFQPD
jgi:hypothetical protein